MTLEQSITAARQAALNAEQPLLRMLAQRKASRRVLREAIARYDLAARLLREALSEMGEG